MESEMKYYARYAHLAELPHHEIGSKITRWDKVGTMGNTGQSTGPHLHFDLVNDFPGYVYRLNEIMGLVEVLLSDLLKQYHYFIDEEMFNSTFRITTYFGDPTYNFGPEGAWKLHPGYDVVSTQKEIYWNRSMEGKVVSKGYDSGYGYFIVICYEV